MKKSISFFALLLFFLFGSFQFIFASGLRATPFRIEETVQPGEEITSFITITNSSDETKTFYADAKDFVPRGEGGSARLVFDDEEREDSLTNWVSFPTPQVRMGPGERREIPIIFTVPEDVGPGGYYGAVVFGPDPPEDMDNEGALISLTHQVGVLALFQVEGMVDETARIREFVTDQSFYNTPFDVEFLTRMDNMGNVHIKPVGSIKVTNMVGSEVVNLPVNDLGSNVLPSTTRRFTTGWGDEFGFGKYDAMLTLSFGTSPDQGGMGIQTATAKTSFWVLPRKLIAGIIIGLIAIILLLRYIFKKYKKRAVEEAVKKAGVDPEKIKEKNSQKTYFYLIVGIIIVLFILIIGTILFLLFA